MQRFLEDHIQYCIQYLQNQISQIENNLKVMKDYFDKYILFKEESKSHTQHTIHVETRRKHTNNLQNHQTNYIKTFITSNTYIYINKTTHLK